MLLASVAVSLPTDEVPEAGSVSLLSLEATEPGTANPVIAVPDEVDWQAEGPELEAVPGKADTVSLSEVVQVRQQQAAARNAAAERQALADAQAAQTRQQQTQAAAASSEQQEAEAVQEVMATQATSDGSERGSLAALVNGHRSNNGLAQLSRDGTLDSFAQGWAEHMASSQSLYHNPNYRSQVLGAGWSSASEIIVRNTGARNWSSSDITSWMFSWWRNSGTHNGEMLRGDITHFGVGYAMGPGGPYAAIVFGG